MTAAAAGADPERIAVEIAPGEAVTALAYRAKDPAGITLILAHGAGASQTSPFMVRTATNLAARGLDVVTFNFAYTEQRRRLPDRTDRLEACYRGVIATVARHATLGQNHLAIGGKSMGGRIATHLAAARVDGPNAVVLLGYPLHPPGKPQQLRSAHLPKIAIPMLLIQGARDPFGTPEELRPILATLSAPTRLFVVEDGDHSFKVRKCAGQSQDVVDRAIEDEIVGWLRQTIG